MGKKKNKIPKITEEQYFAYIAQLKNTAAANGSSSDKEDRKPEIIVEGGS